MTNDADISPTPLPSQPPLPFGLRLKKSRENLGLERKEAAAQLRLNENIIVMLEKERLSSDLPPTFIRGYLRAYGKLLQIPDSEIKKAVELIKPHSYQSPGLAVLETPSAPFLGKNVFVHFFTYLIFLTLIGLTGTWGYFHYLSSIKRTPDLSMNALLKTNKKEVPEDTSPSETATPQQKNPHSEKISKEETLKPITDVANPAIMASTSSGLDPLELSEENNLKTNSDNPEEDSFNID